MIRHILLALALALAAGVASSAQAQSVQVVTSCSASGVNAPLGNGGRLYVDINGNLCTTGGGGGGGGSTGSVTAAGTNGTVAQAVQGITGGVPQNSFTGQYNSSLPTLTSGQPGYVALDSNGRQILSPSVTLPVSIVDGGDATEGAKADAAATNASGSWSVVAMLKGIYNALIGPTPAGNFIIGKVGIDQTTPGTTNGVAAIGTDGTTQRQIRTTTTGALEPPTAATGKITQTQVSLAATTSTTLIAANTSRIAVEIQCDGTAPVGIDRTGAALTSATAAPLVIPSGSYPLYTMPIATLTAITAYTATAQSCRVTEYIR